MDDIEKKQQVDYVEHNSKELLNRTTAEPSVKNDDDFLANFLGKVSDDAKDVNDAEKQMSLLQGLRTYPKAIMWSVVVSSSLVMEGFDLALLSSLYALPAFKQTFGEYKKGTYEIPSRWQTGLTMCVNCGEIIGLQIAGYFADRFGYRRTLATALVFVACFIFIVFFAPSLAVLAVGEILLGTCFGCFQTMAVNYAADVCPLALRFYLTTYINICWCVGQLIASGVLRAKSNDPTIWAYKVPYAVQWIWPVPILIGIILAPESPWWLVRVGKLKEAKHSLKRLLTQQTDGPSVEHSAEQIVKWIKLTNDMEKERHSGTSYWDCFKGVDLRRTEITVLTWLFQNECGNALMVYSTYFYEQAGLTTDFAFNFTIIQYALGVIGCILSWFAISYVGRFHIYFGGMCAMCVLMLVVGCLGLAPKNLVGPKWAVGSLLMVFVFIYDLTVGPVCYAIVSEMASSRLRIKTVIIARNVYNIGGIFNAIVTPYMLNPQDWNWGSKTGFFWAGSCFLGILWSWFRLPETKGRTFAELDVLFEEKVFARKFTSTEVDPFDVDNLRSRLKKNELEEVKVVDEGEDN